jgi:hypothetical protein
MFAGPNGPGKSTLKQYLSEKLLGVYINPDDIEKDIRVRGFLDLSMYGIAASDSSVLPVFTGSEFLKSVQRCRNCGESGCSGLRAVARR